MLYDIHKTNSTPQLAIKGGVDLYVSMRLEKYGAYLVRPKGEKSYFVIAMPMMGKVLTDTHLNRTAQITQDGNDFSDEVKVYESRLAAIKAGDEEVVDSILAEHGIDDDFFTREPFPHQKAGMAFFLASFGHVCIFDEMRTGKTKQAIDIATYLLKEKMISAVLVIVPNTIKWLWQREFLEDSPLYAGFSTVITGTKKKKRYKWQDLQFIYIVNYESARADADELRKWEEQHSDYLLICDEAHALKNPAAQQTKVVVGLKPKYSIFMTGTPISTWPEDAWSMTNKVCPGILGPSLYHFQQKFADKGGYKGKEIKGYHDLPEIKYRLARISLRRRRKDIMFDQSIYLNWDGDMKGDQKKAYEEVRDQLYTELMQNDELTIVKIGNHLTKTLRLHQITSGFLSNEAGQATWFEDNWKLKEIDSFIDDYLDEVGKVVIWSRFVPPIYYLTDRYEKYGAVYIKGSMGDQADENMYRFQNDPDCKVVVCQIQTSAGRGLNPATVCIFLDKWWTPLLNAQARDRIVGIKNPVPVTVFSLITKDAIDERIEFLLGQRQQWADAITGDTNEDDITLPKMDRATLLYLLANPEEARGYEEAHK